MDWLLPEISLPERSLDQRQLTRAKEAAAPSPAGPAAADRPPNDLEGLQQAATQFESLFYGQLIRAMRATVPENSLWNDGGATKIYRQLHDQALADRMADGGGLGIAALIVRQFAGQAAAGETTGQRIHGTPVTRPPALSDPRGLAAYRRHSLAAVRPDALARLRERAEAVGGAAADSLQRWRREVAQAAETTGLDPALVLAVMVRESGGDPQAVSARGARGLMQLMPGTARELGVDDPADPLQNLLGGSRYLAAMLQRYDGDLDLALAAYNAGPGTIDRLGGRIPNYPETRRYVAAVRDLAERLGAPTGTNLVSGKNGNSQAPSSR